jgi:hypothetical protein
MSEETLLPEVNMSSIIQRVVNNEDDQRLRSMCSLLNTFNYAVQIQGGRKNWNPDDFRLYCIALAAMDQIGMHTNENTTRDELGLKAVGTAMRPAHNSHAK